jgi:predicted DNA-binding mobile mystery protein A
VIIDDYIYIGKMNIKQKKLMREQLDATLKRFVELKSIHPPRKGWIRAIRDALNISTRQLGDRLGVNKSRITRIEQDELSGSVTIKTMGRIAKSLDCEFVYGFVPRTSLEDTLKNQATLVAKKRMIRVAHTMVLEDQGLPENEQKKVFKNIVDELVRTAPKSLWEVEK